MGHALVLNATYEPLCVVSARRALILVLNEKAISVEDSSSVVHSAAATVPLPAVVRLNRYVRVPYRAGIPLTRRAIFARDGGRCVYCGAAATSVDHVVPRSRGGEHVWENVVAACRRCNHVKSDRNVSELGWGPRPNPRQPSGPVWRILGTGRHDPRWLPYLAGYGFPDEATA
ncbi:MAG TPA: HNH endonuclease [Sporichthyaceae bacterium]|nr:HNH endonuclease [Sporichthyaceae bacterium]